MIFICDADEEMRHEGAQKQAPGHTGRGVKLEFEPGCVDPGAHARCMGSDMPGEFSLGNVIPSGTQPESQGPLGSASSGTFLSPVEHVFFDALFDALSSLKAPGAVNCS